MTLDEFCEVYTDLHSLVELCRQFQYDDNKLKRIDDVSEDIEKTTRGLLDNVGWEEAKNFLDSIDMSCRFCFLDGTSFESVDYADYDYIVEDIYDQAVAERIPEVVNFDGFFDEDEEDDDEEESDDEIDHANLNEFLN